MRNVNMNPRLFTREEEQTERTVPDDGGCHIWTVADGSMAARDFVHGVDESSKPALVRISFFSNGFSPDVNPYTYGVARIYAILYQMKLN